MKTLKQVIDEMPERERLAAQYEANGMEWPRALPLLKPVGWDFMPVRERRNHRLAIQVYELLTASLCEAKMARYRSERQLAENAVEALEKSSAEDDKKNAGAAE